MAFFATTKELRSSLAMPEKWLVNWVGGGVESHSGVLVTEDTAMNYSALYCGTNILAGSLMQLPLHLMQKMKGDDRRKATEHPVYPFVHSRVNKKMTSPRFRQTGQGHLVIWGNLYARIDWGGNGYPRGLYLLRPDRMRVQVKDGKVIYEYRPKTGVPQVIHEDNLLHIPGFGYDGIMGYSLITLARESIGLGLAEQEYGARFYGSGTHPSVIFKHPKTLKKETKEDLRKDLAKKHSGLGKSHKALLLEEGITVENISINPRDAQFLESRKFSLLEMARWLNLPPHMLKDMDRAKFSNIEHNSIEFMVHTMGPWLKLWETELSRVLLREDERQAGYYIEFNIDGFLRGDQKARYEAYAIGRQWGWLTPNMILKKENEAPMGPEGDIALIPANMIPASSAGTGVEEKSQRQALELRADWKRTAIARIRLGRNYHPMFVDAVGRIVRREVNDIKRAIKKHLNNRDSFDLGKWIDNFYREIPDYINRNMRSVISSYSEGVAAAAADEVGVKLDDYKDDLERFTREYVDVFTTRHIASAQGQLQELIKETEVEELAAVLEERLDEWEEKTPEKVAAREVVDGRSAFATVIFFGAGYDLIWRAQGDSCLYCKALDGKRIGRGGHFVEPDKEFEPEGADGSMKIRGPKKHPQLHQGCDCIITAG